MGRGALHVVAASRKRRKGKNKMGGEGDGVGAGDGDVAGGDSTAARSDGSVATLAATVEGDAATTGLSPRQQGVTNGKEKEKEKNGGDVGASATTKVAAEPLPTVSRDDVLNSCVGTTAWMLGIGLVLREGTHFGQDVLPAVVPDWTASLPLVAALHPPFEPSDLAVHATVAVAAAAAVTAARAALLETWPEFAEATNRSNAQVLTPLYKGDVVTVSVLPAVAEETLFRGVLLPALGGGPVGVIGAGAVFGALHTGKDRVTYCTHAPTFTPYRSLSIFKRLKLYISSVTTPLKHVIFFFSVMPP